MLAVCGDDEFYFQECSQAIRYALWKEYSRYGLSRFSHAAKESTWVHRIAYTAVCAYLRKYDKRPPTLSIDNSLLDMVLTDEELAAKERLLELVAHLDSDADRRLVEYRLEGYSQAEMAKIEGVKVATISKRMSLLMKKLMDIAARLEGAGGDAKTTKE